MDERYRQYKLNSALPEIEEPLFTDTINVTPDKQQDKMTDITMNPEAAIATPIGASDITKEKLQAGAKGVTQGTLGAPGDLVGLVAGLINMFTKDTENIGNWEQFLQGYESIPFTSEDIKQRLEAAGWKSPEGQQGAEMAGEIMAPGVLVGGTAKGIKKLIKSTKSK